MYKGGIAEDFPKHEFCKSLAISIISEISRITKINTYKLLISLQGYG